MTNRIPLVTAGLLLVGALLFVWQGFAYRGFAVTTDISEFIPSSGERQKAQLSKAIIDSELSRTWVVTLHAQDSKAAVQASRALEAELRMDKDLMGRLTFLQGGPPQGTDQAVWELYQPRSLSFAARNREAARELVTEAGLRRTVKDLKRRLQSPLSTLVSRVAPQDPFLALPRLFESLDQGQGQGQSLSIIDERFIAEERYAVLLFGTRDSALDADAQRKVFAGLQSAFRRLNNSALKLETSSLGRYSMQAERTIKSDIQRITWVSVIAMLTLCLLLFGSLRLMLLALVPVAAGMLAGLTTTLLIYGQVHGLTLAVGASLIGVCIDYVVHFYAHQLLVPAEHPFGTMRRIWTGLLLGCSTTAIGFLVLAGSSFPGLRQISLFACSGVVVALATTRWVVPMLVDKRSVSKPLLRRLAERLQASLVFVQGSGRSARLRGWTLLAVAMAMSATGAWFVTWDDDMANLAKADPQLRAEDERVRQRVGRFDVSRFVVAAGADEEHALQVNDQVTETLLRSREAGDLGGWQNIASLLPSQRTQQQVADVLRDPQLKPRLSAVLEEQGFKVDIFQPFFKKQSNRAPSQPKPPTPLTYRDLSDSNLAALVRPFRVQLPGKTAFVTFLRDVQNPKALGANIAHVPGATFIDQGALMTSVSESYRKRMVQLLVLGLLLVWLTLLVRYRNLRTSLAAFAPALLSAGVTVFVLFLLGLPLSLLGLTALLMILSIGVDYGVFLTESVHEQANQPSGSLHATLAGLFVAWFSTVFGFGVLALSQQPALRIIGVVAGIGVTSALLLAPTALTLLRPSAATRRRA